jgi:predicted acetyltransferase
MYIEVKIMSIYLKELSINDGVKELEYLRKLPYNENGFYNPAESEDLVDEVAFKNWLNQRIMESKGENLKEGYVPQTIYWVMDQDEIVGIGKMRHYLNEKLLEQGGHIGLGISNTCRTKGVGTEALKLLLDKAEEIGIEDVLLTNNENNFASRRIVEKCGGVLESINDGHCKYWIKLKTINKQR